MALSLLLSMVPPNPNAQRYSPTMMWDSTVRTFTSPPTSFWEEAEEVGRVNPQWKGKGLHGQEGIMGHVKKFSSSLTVA